MRLRWIEGGRDPTSCCPEANPFINLHMLSDCRATAALEKKKVDTHKLRG